ncbi:MAG TPA: hypothetical protein VLF67_00775 [Candidatus Saccharimonas sp.]|nr:hypothetical protein [Candidatus Saccharimonas sp.]
MFWSRKQPAQPAREPHPDPIIEAQLRHIDTLEAHVASRLGQIAEHRADINQLGQLNASFSQRAAGTGYYHINQQCNQQICNNDDRIRQLQKAIRQLEADNNLDHQTIIGIRQTIQAAVENLVFRPLQGNP